MGQRRGHEHAIIRSEAVHQRHRLGLADQAAMGVPNALGNTCRAGREQHDGERRRIHESSGRDPRLDPTEDDRLDEHGPGQLRRGQIRQGDDHPGGDLLEGGRQVSATGRVMDRRRDGTQPPAGAIEEIGLEAVGELPTHDVAGRHAHRRKPTRPLPHRAIDRRAGKSTIPVDDRHLDGRKHHVEGGHIPRSTWPVEGSSRGGHGRRS